MNKITIAIDGHSSCGKSTMAKDLARRVGYIYVDTGAMYRSVTLYALRHGLISDDGTVDASTLQQHMPQVQISFQLNAETGRPDTYLNGECVEQQIRSLEVSNHVSPVAALPFVREAMVAQQQLMGQGGGVVMDGRDIGTVVFPHAELKVFVTASAEVRAQRRYDELLQKGMPADYADILRNVQERDYIDSHREVSPLRQADDALLLDNSHLTIEEQNAWLMARFQEALSKASGDSADAPSGSSSADKPVANLAVFASGSGTNCENLIRYFRDSSVARVTLVVSNKADAPVLARATALGVAVAVVPKAQLADPSVVLPLLQEHGVSFVVLAGFLPLVPDYLIDAFPRRIVNLHPALLPKYGGKGMWGHHVHEAVWAAREKETGMTVHYVTPVCDSGEIIAQYSVELSPSDTPDDIAAKEHQLEMQFFPQVIEQLLKG